MNITWPNLVDKAAAEISGRQLNGDYKERLDFEISEVCKQGAEAVWLDRYRDNKKFASNPNNLVFPWLLGMVVDDPLANRSTQFLNTVRASKVLGFKEQHGFVPHDLIKDPDSPDIDLDCLPDARDPLKEYAIEKYGKDFDDGYGSVCSVGTWQTYKFKSAIVDTAIALNFADRGRGKKTEGAAAKLGIHSITAELPEDVDELKENGKAVCKTPAANGKDCGFAHAGLVCPKCGGEDTDGPTLAKLIKDYPTLAKLDEELSEALIGGIAFREYSGGLSFLELSANLVGRIRNMGMHAGAIIITNRPLYGNIPMSLSGKKGYWTSMWTEGRNTQLSKFGYIKWDLLGLKTLEYIFKCCKLIEENRGISFGKNMEGMDYNNPRLRHAGYYFDGDGVKHFINLDDPGALSLANQQKTDGVFQFDTDLAKSTLANQSYSFEDLMLFNAMGHPGPMASIPEAVKNRDDTAGGWKARLRPEFLAVLENTYGVIVYQEQLQELWQNIAGFTSPEAQEARKAVAKKHTHKFKPIEEKWLTGATKLIGRAEAEDWWTRMVTFGRYAFNRSHAVSYCLVALKCLWLKRHFAPEFWASVMSDCHPDKLVRYMGVARAEEWTPTAITYCGKFKGNGKVKSVMFDAVNIENLTTDFTVTGDTVNQGLIGVKGIGEKAAIAFQGRGKYASIDDFVNSAEGRRRKTVIERFIKLGAFRHIPGHENSFAVWQWYQYKYCSGLRTLKNEIKAMLLADQKWDDKAIQKEKDRQIAEWKKVFPKRNKVPAKYNNWKPTPDDSREKVMALFKNDFEITDLLKFQETYLGYWITSPLEQFNYSGGRSFAFGKESSKYGGTIVIEGIVIDVTDSITKNMKPFLKVTLNDGVQTGMVFIWSNELAMLDLDVLKEKTGVSMVVEYNAQRGLFSLARGETIRRLKLKKKS